MIKNITNGCLTLVVLVLFTIGHVVERFKIVDTSQILTVWITAEVMSLVSEPIYFQLFVPWLNKESDDDVKLIYKDYKEDKKSRFKDLKMTLITSINPSSPEKGESK